MRTAVVRIGVDPDGDLSAAQLDTGMSTLAELAESAGAQLIENNLAGLPPARREVELLMTGPDPGQLQDIACELCDKAFGTRTVAGVLTFISHGTDEDAHGVLAGFGLSGDIQRMAGTEGWDIVTVTLRKADLQRVPESRVYTALGASLNCEVKIVAV